MVILDIPLLFETGGDANMDAVIVVSAPADVQREREQLEYVTAIKESSNNLLVIINDLLDLSKIKAGKMVFEATPFKLSDLFF